ncbi:MAG: DPP IV N-terminal domain-containing protein [Bacteroidales bacterium]|nr:DPP IV N-terminal domain-containing protein [Bacteroidales bacterium]
MGKIFFFVISFLLLNLLGFCQKNITIDEFFNGVYRVTKPENIQWIRNTDKYSYSLNNSIWMGSAKSPKAKEIATLDIINKLLGTSVDQIPEFTFLSEDTIQFHTDDKNMVFLVDFKKKSIISKITVDSLADSISISSINTVAYSKNGDVYIIDKNRNVKRVTENKPNITSGMSVARNEFGITKSFIWSASENKVAFYEKNEADIQSFPFVNYSSSNYPSVSYQKYPFAGTANEKYRIGVYNFVDSTLIYLNSGNFDGYLTNVSWSPDDNYIYVVFLTRNQKMLTVKQFDASTGNYVRTIFSEEHKLYVEPENGLLFASNQSNEFLWLSEKSGYKHLYHYTVDGELLNPLTSGDWEITDVVGFDNTGKNFYFIGTSPGNKFGRDIYVVNVISLKVTKLTNSVGVHAAVLNSFNGTVLDVFSSNKSVYDISILNNRGEKVQDVYSAVNPLLGYSLPQVGYDSIVTPDKIVLNYKIIKPSHFNEKIKYPIILNVYGGPHVQMIKNIWLGFESFLPYLLAEQGYVVLTIDGRGAYGYGFNFESKIYGELGKVETIDQKSILDVVKKNSWADTTKIGVYGSSFGGFMTLKMLQTYPSAFKAGISMFPVTDWNLYEIMYTERYMGTPQSNAAGYQASSVLGKVEKIKSKCLIIGGGHDDVTLPINYYSFVDECVEKNVPVDMFIYPNAKHGVLTINSRFHLYQKIISYFDTHLK